jgi:hypothetical protein
VLHIFSLSPLDSNVARPYCRSFLEEHQISPFSTLRHWMRTFSRVVKNTPRPMMVRWIGTERLQLEKDEIRIEEYKGFLRSQMEQLEELVNEKVLLGISLEKIGIDISISSDLDTGDENTVGYGPLTPEQAHSQNNKSGSATTLDNADSDRLFAAMVEAGALGISRGRAGITWDRIKCMEWLHSIHTAWTLAYCLFHVTAGIAGRGTEESLFQIVNSTLGRRHVFAEKQSIAIISNYHKGASSSRLFKHVLRLLPYRLANIFMILIRCIRPLELSVLLEFSVPHQEVQQVANTCQTWLFATWGKHWDSNTQSQMLSAWFFQGIGIRMGIRKYRHFATALQREYIKTPETDPLALAADQQAAHERITSEINYALIVGSSSLPRSRREWFVMVSILWHRMLGFEAFPVVSTV